MNKAIMVLSVLVFAIVNLIVLAGNLSATTPVSPTIFFTGTASVLMFGYAYYNEEK